MNYQEALNYIGSVSWKGSVPGLERISALMHLLGDPQKKLKFIHIGGTNGKGSAAAFISNIFRSAGYKTGLFISPFIESFNERMQINNQYISDDELAQITDYIRPFADSMEDSPTEFELNTAIAFEYFSRNNCSIVVLEVGMGGEFDATNIIDCPELAVLMSVGLDHMEYLGDTVEKIARTKAGIIKPGTSVVLYKQSAEVTNVIRERCLEVNACLYISEPEELSVREADIDHQTFDSAFGELTIHLPARYQKNNLAVVLKAVQVLRKMGYDLDDAAVRQGLSETRWPGRFEVLHKEPVFLADGAHNPQGMEAAVSSLRALFGERKLIFIIGVLADEDYGQLLNIMIPLAKTVLCVAPDSARALSSGELAKEVSKRTAGNEDVSVMPFDNVKDAVRHAFDIAAADDVICSIGSLYLIGDIKKYCEENKMKTSERTCPDFIDVLSSKEPVPGGGGAAALCAAIGTALGNMVGSLTEGKKKYAQVQSEILEMKDRCSQLQKECLELIDADGECFLPLANAYSLPSETEEEKMLKSDTIEKYSKEAAKVPLQIMEKCCKAIELADRFARIGSRLAVSDAGCAACILRGALEAASLNVFINTKGLKDREYADKINAYADEMIEKYGQKAQDVLDTVLKSIR